MLSKATLAFPDFFCPPTEHDACLLFTEIREKINTCVAQPNVCVASLADEINQCFREKDCEKRLLIDESPGKAPPVEQETFAELFCNTIFENSDTFWDSFLGDNLGCDEEINKLQSLRAEILALQEVWRRKNMTQTILGRVKNLNCKLKFAYTKKRPF